MTPAALRAAIASARLRPRMYAQTAEHLASMLYGMVAGAASDGVDVGPAWGDAYSPANVHAPTDAEVCDAAEATVAALWPQGDAPARRAAEAGALDLDAIEARANAATMWRPDECELRDEDGEPWAPQGATLGETPITLGDTYDGSASDWCFVAHARTDVPALVARVRELEAEVAAAQPAPLPRIACPFCEGGGSTRARDQFSGCVAVAQCVACGGSGEVPTLPAPLMSPETLAAWRRNSDALSGAYLDARGEIDRLTAEVERLRRSLADASAVRPAQPDALDLDAIAARVSLPTCSQCGAVDPPTEPAESLLGERFARHVDCPRRDPLFASNVAVRGLTRAEQREVVDALRDREREVADLDALVQRQGALLLATANALKGPPPPLSQHSAHDLPEVAAAMRLSRDEAATDALRCAPDDPEADGTDAAHPAWWRGNDAGCAGSLAVIDRQRAEIDALKAQLAAAQPAPLDFHGALAAVRNGRFVPAGNADRAQVAALASPRGADFFRGLMEFDGPQVCPRCQTLADLGDHGAEECEMRRDKGADRDLCPKCGTLDRDHTAEECAQRQRELAARWAEQHPGAAAGFVGAERAPRESA